LRPARRKGDADLPEIATALHMEVDNLFPVGETLQMLGFAEEQTGRSSATP
jgi:NitT/TauT family transport system ATP-binding protein